MPAGVPRLGNAGEGSRVAVPEAAIRQSAGTVAALDGPGCFKLGSETTMHSRLDLAGNPLAEPDFAALCTGRLGALTIELSGTDGGLGGSLGVESAA
jgi:hypothetical protein